MAKPDRNAEFPTLQQATQQQQTAAAVTGPAKADPGGVTEGLAAMGIREAVMTSLRSSTSRSDSPVDKLPPQQQQQQQGKPTAIQSKKHPSDISLFELPSSGSSFNANPERNCKFVDDLHQMQDSLQHFLTDNEDFLVVGVLGPQGSGKSTVINAMYARTEGEAKSVNTVYTRFLLWR